CRYADDCNVYVASRAAAKHAMAAITEFLEEELKLRVNRDKSAWARPWERKVLGYSFTWHRQARLKIAAESLKRLHEKVRQCLRAGRGRSLSATINALNPVLRGWMSYFRLTQVQGVLEELDGWVRRKLRCLLWRQWKRSYTRAKALQKRGLSEQTAWTSATNGRGAWWNAGAAHMHAAFTKSDFDRLGLVSLVDRHRRWRVFSCTAGCGTARPVVWEGGERKLTPYPIDLQVAGRSNTTLPSNTVMRTWVSPTSSMGTLNRWRSSTIRSADLPTSME